MKNHFEHLRIEQFENVPAFRTYDRECIVDIATERVELLLHVVSVNKVALGYNIYFANGRKADRLPSLEYGYFKTRKNAMLYFLGYMQQYSDYFSPETMEQVKDKISKLIQHELF